MEYTSLNLSLVPGKASSAHVVPKTTYIATRCSDLEECVGGNASKGEVRYRILVSERHILWTGLH